MTNRQRHVAEGLQTLILTPRMVNDVLYPQSFILSALQQTLEQFPTVLGHSSELVIANVRSTCSSAFQILQLFFVERGLLHISTKGWFPIDHAIENGSDGPSIAGFRAEPFIHLRCGADEGVNFPLDSLTLLEVHGGTEVHNFANAFPKRRVLSLQHDAFWSQTSVTDMLVMQVDHNPAKLRYDRSAFCLCEAASSNDGVR
mmetsp:Transcript_58353/g.103726  ORF Transcript_58353/g.103726 Transcript_58353/m.103726 type:complete len:201 (+) Transcript_58353:807-1409(+)